MKARRELNARLYAQKIYSDEPQKIIPNDYYPIKSGDAESVKLQLKSGTLSLFKSSRTLSSDGLRNAVYNFVAESEKIICAALSAGMSLDEAYALCGIYIGKADKCTDIDGVSALFADLCLDFAERIGELRTKQKCSVHIKRCIDYIYANLGGNLSVSALSRAAKLNQSYLSRLFSKEMGVPIKRFVTSARIDTAKNLLKSTDLSYAEIAYALNFSSQSAFIRTFKKETGFTPKKYKDT